MKTKMVINTHEKYYNELASLLNQYNNILKNLLDLEFVEDKYFFDKLCSDTKTLRNRVERFFREKCEYVAKPN